MVTIKTPEEIEILKEGGKRLACVLNEVAGKVAPGISTKELDTYAEKLIREGGPSIPLGAGDEPSFLNYKPQKAVRPFPATLCTSINDEVVHGVPSKNKVLKEGDIISIDCGLKHKGLYTDMALTVPVGKIGKETKKLLDVTREALYVGISAARGGNYVGDIGTAIEAFAGSHGLGIVRTLSGHGVGHEVHEDPHVPNFGKPGEGEKLKPGMVLALEPMFTLGRDEIILDPDSHTFRTKDGSGSAHFEHTILITEKEAEILTQA